METNSTNYDDKHSEYLERLCSYPGLKEIDEDPYNICLLLREPNYLFNKSENQKPCPDLFIGYYNHQWTVAELKHSKDKRKKAIQQIESGVGLLVDYFGVPLKDITGKFVLYRGNRFRYETISF